MDPILEQRELRSYRIPVGEVGGRLDALDLAQSDRAGGEASPCQESTPCELSHVAVGSPSGSIVQTGAKATSAPCAPIGVVSVVVLVEGTKRPTSRWRRSPSAAVAISPPSASTIVPIGGAQAIGAVPRAPRPSWARTRSSQASATRAKSVDYRRALERAGLGSSLTRAGMERLGFFVCVEDLEHALGPRSSTSPP